MNAFCVKSPNDIWSRSCCTVESKMKPEYILCGEYRGGGGGREKSDELRGILKGVCCC